MANNLHLKFYLKGYISVKEWVYQFVDGDLEPRLVSAQPPQHLLDQGVKVSSLFRGGEATVLLRLGIFQRASDIFRRGNFPNFQFPKGYVCLLRRRGLKWKPSAETMVG